MIFSRILPFFALALSFSFLAVAKPVAETGVIVKRTDGAADVVVVLATLKAKTDGILPQINSLVGSGDANSNNIIPLIEELINAFTTAKESFTELKGKVGARQLGPTKAEVAALISPIITAVVTTLGRLLIRAAIFLPTLPTLIVALDLAVRNLLFSVEAIVDGVLVLVAGSLFDVAGLLTSVGLALVVVLLGF